MTNTLSSVAAPLPDATQLAVDRTRYGKGTRSLASIAGLLVGALGIVALLGVYLRQ